MARCRHCGGDLTYKLADGSCPDCYSTDAVERPERTERPFLQSASSRFNQEGKTRSTAVDLGGPRLKDVIRSGVLVRPTGSRFESLRISSSNSRPPEFLPADTKAQPAAPEYRFGTQRGLPMRDTTVARPSNRDSVVPPKTQPLVPLQARPLSSKFLHAASLNRLDGLEGAPAKHMSETGGHDAVTQLFNVIGERRADVLSCIDACENFATLDGYANHLQMAVKIVDSFRMRVLERRKSLTSSRFPSHSNANANRNIPRNEADADPIVSTIVVKKLPKIVERADLVAYFETFCKHRREVQNVVLPKDHQTREGKSFAYVTFARGEIVREICRQQKHTMVAKMGTFGATEHQITVEPYNEAEQLKKKAKYEIFVHGTSSFMSELDFVEIVGLEHGKVKEIYYCSNRGNPGLGNGYAMLTFEDPEVTKKVLEAGEVKVNGRTLACKPWENSKKHAAKNNERDGKAGRDQERKKKNPKDIDEDRLCCVCVDQLKCILFRPCNHIPACEECATKLDSCPYCRQPSIEKVKAFM